MKNVVENVENISFSKGCDEWLNFKKNSIKESSYLNYRFKIIKHLKPDLGNKSLAEISEYDMNEYIKTKKDELDNPALKDMVILIKSIFRFLKKKYHVDFDLDFKYGPRANYNEVEVFNEYEKMKLTKYLLESNNQKTLGILISFYAGLRIGEVCGLKWEDIDLENKVIAIRRTIQRVYLGKKQSKIIITTPKTRNSFRKVPISKIIIDKLKEMSTRFPKNSFVITGKADKCMEPILYRYTYKKVLRACTIPYKKYHCLRHTFATRCIRVGMDIKSLSEVLGHADIAITLSIYVHSSFEVKKKYMDKL